MPSFYFFWGQLGFYFNKFKLNRNAVSPVIGVILMVAITVIVAAVVAVFGFGFGATTSKPPIAAITVTSNPDTPLVAIKMQHRSGDILRAGQWRLSIVPAGQSPAFQISSTDFKPTDIMITTNMTSGAGNYTVTNRTVSCSGCSSINLISGVKYDVKIIVFPFHSMVVDTVVEVR